MRNLPCKHIQCDEVEGTEHLRTPVEVGIKIIEGMRGHTSGLVVPTFIIGLSQGGGKVPLQPNSVLARIEEESLLKNYEGHVFRYRNPREQTHSKLTAVASLLNEPELHFESEGAKDADRVIVRS